MGRGHTITLQTGEAIAKDMRNRRFRYERKRVPSKAIGDSGSGAIEYQITAIRTAASTGDDAPYNGLTIATVTVKGTSAARSDLIGTSVDVVDHSGEVFDLASASLVGLWGWANEMVFQSLAPGAGVGDLTPVHWSAADRACTASGA